MKDEVHRFQLIQSFLNGRPIEVHPAPTDVRALLVTSWNCRFKAAQ
jgi:hypothetical protein